MIFPKNLEESAEWQKNVDKNREAGEWVNTDFPTSVLPDSTEVTQRVGGIRLPLKK